jgi:hypothetical protein
MTRRRRTPVLRRLPWSLEPKAEDLANCASATHVNAWPIFKRLPARFLIAATPFAEQLGGGLLLFADANGQLLLKFLEASDDRLHVAVLIWDAPP